MRAAKKVRIDDVRLVWSWDDDSGDSRAQHCQAVAEVSYVVGSAGERRIDWLKSSGLCGVYIDGPNDPYQREIELEQLSNLQDHLEAFGVDCRDFAQRWAPELQP